MSSLGLADKCWPFSMQVAFATHMCSERQRSFTKRKTNQMKSDSCTDYAEGLKYSQAPYFPPLLPIRHLDEVWGNTKAGNEIDKQPPSAGKH